MESTITDYITMLLKENVLTNKPKLKGKPYFVMNENDNLNNDSAPDDKNVENFNQTRMYINHNTSIHLQKSSPDQYQLEDNSKKQLEDTSKNMQEEIAAKNTIIKVLSENLNQITNSFFKTNNKNIITKNQENGHCHLPKDNKRSKKKKFINI